jgi:hypothetical protein
MIKILSVTSHGAVIDFSSDLLRKLSVFITKVELLSSLASQWITIWIDTWISNTLDNNSNNNTNNGISATFQSLMGGISTKIELLHNTLDKLLLLFHNYSNPKIQVIYRQYFVNLIDENSTYFKCFV